jgi:hypothetical protein
LSCSSWYLLHPYNSHHSLRHKGRNATQFCCPERFAVHRAAAARGLFVRGGVHQDSGPLIQTGGTFNSTRAVCSAHKIPKKWC